MVPCGTNLEFEVPQADGLVGGRGEDVAAVRRDVHRVHGRAVPHQPVRRLRRVSRNPGLKYKFFEFLFLKPIKLIQLFYINSGGLIPDTHVVV